MRDRVRSAPGTPRRLAIIIGQWPNQLVEVSHLLHRSGFACDVITTRPFRARARSTRRLLSARNVAEMVRLAVEALQDRPALVTIVDDPTLRAVLDAPLDEATKAALLPVTSPDHFFHLCSKIGLSRLLEREGIATPRFRVAATAEEVPSCADELGYPVLVKVDESSAGYGVFECATRSAAVEVSRRGLRYPLLVQEKIEGEALDLSGFYREGRLVHFCHAVMERGTHGRFSPSNLRRYAHPGAIDPRIFDELGRLGRALGIDGFSNVSCITSTADARRYYFEADLRPNVWVNHPRFLGDDPAAAIRDCFDRGVLMTRPRRTGPDRSSTMLMPYVFRLPIRDVLCNRYDAWRFLGDRPWTDLVRHVAHTLGGRLCGIVRRIFSRRKNGR